ncbi:glycosyltransferase family 2 protein [Lysobacter sp. HA35]
MERATGKPSIAVVIPAYRVKAHVLDVIAAVGPECARIYVVDDCCPDGTGQFVAANCHDPRVCVLRHDVNQGVGGAMLTGYAAALDDRHDIIVKIDGDGQMDPSLIPIFTAPIARGEADYTKGNRFYDLRNIGRMPLPRLVGNAVLSFLTKLSTGYWDVFDPTNGYTAVHASVAGMIPADKVSRRYFFETDFLFRLGTFRAVVVDIPMDAIYGDEQSNLRIGQVIFEFAAKHTRNGLKRLGYTYFLRDVSLASLELVVGTVLLLFGGAYGAWNWWKSAETGIPAHLGTITVATMSILVALQLLLGFFAYDISNTPRYPLQRRLRSSDSGNYPGSRDD